MFERSHEISGALLRDSARRSLVVTVPASTFVLLPVAEIRAGGPVREVPLVTPDDLWMSADKIVTCVMVVWAVTIFAGMGFLAAVI